MPFKSKSQRKFLFANKPKIAREFANKTPKGKRLPERVGKRKKLFMNKKSKHNGKTFHL